MSPFRRMQTKTYNKEKGYIYKFCVKQYCYYGFSKNPQRREQEHRTNLVNIYNDWHEYNLDYKCYLNYGDDCNYDRRYYKMLLMLINLNLTPNDFIFEIIDSSYVLSL